MKRGKKDFINIQNRREVSKVTTLVTCGFINLLQKLLSEGHGTF